MSTSVNDSDDIETIEANAEHKATSDKEIPEEDKKSKTLKKVNPMLDARRRIEDIIEARKMINDLDYIFDAEYE